jgi:hypothetical protein
VNSVPPFPKKNHVGQKPAHISKSCPPITSKHRTTSESNKDFDSGDWLGDFKSDSNNNKAHKVEKEGLGEEEKEKAMVEDLLVKYEWIKEEIQHEQMVCVFVMLMYCLLTNLFSLHKSISIRKQISAHKTYVPYLHLVSLRTRWW